MGILLASNLVYGKDLYIVTNDAPGTSRKEDNKLDGDRASFTELPRLRLESASFQARGKEGAMSIIHRLFSLFVLFLCLNAWGESPQKEIKYVPVKPTSPASGQEMYTAYCAVCHGREGLGNGPAAEALKVAPTDLTILARRNGNHYPYNHVMSAITGDLHLAVHGSKEMPVWGGLFWG